MPVLVLEASTSAVKAMVYDRHDGVVSLASEPYGPDIDKGGIHDAAAVFAAAMRVGRTAAAGQDIAAVALVGVWHSVVPLGSDMEPVGPAYLWNFTGTATIARTIREQEDVAARIYQNTGCMPNVTYQPYALLHMRENGFDLTDKTFASQAGYIYYKLTGEHLETRNIVSGMGFLNIHEGVYDNGVMELCGIGPQQLGRLVDYRDVRPLGRAGADLLGIAPGVPVVPPHSDGGLNQLGNGAMRPGWMTFSVGTSAAIRLSTGAPVLSNPPATWCYVGAEGWLAGAATNGAGNCMNWFKDTVLGNKWSWDELGRDLLTEGHTPVFLPFLFGERCPGWQDTRRGGFEDLTGLDDERTMFRAVAEGILFNIYQCYEILTAIAGTPERIILSGGILNSPGWMQMAADIFGRDLTLSDNPHASLLGGAALALNAAGQLENIAEFGDTGGETVSPRPGLDWLYKKKFDRYLAWYSRLSPRTGSMETS
ncbi:MAG: hypothetical protein LUC93_02775 [Planctomycetaceae bacterium]|nr:hypothetical protein [Planctomycetaceae bacterium]